MTDKAPTYRRLELMLEKLLRCKKIAGWCGGVRGLVATYNSYLQQEGTYEIGIGRLRGGFSVAQKRLGEPRITEHHIFLPVNRYRTGHLIHGVEVARRDLGLMLSDLCEEVEP